MADVVIEGAEAWSAEGTGERADVACIVVHGFTGNPVSTRPLGEHLHDDGFTVEVLQLPGHGTTPRAMARTTYADWLAAVEAAVDQQLAAGRQVVLVGLSMGGTLALDVGARREVAGIVPINGLVLDADSPLLPVMPLLQRVVPLAPAGLVGVTENDIKGGGDERAYERVPLGALVSLLRALPRVRAQLATVEAPVLVCSSTVDHTVPPENSRALVELLPGDVRFLELADSWHLATLDLDKDLLFDTVSAFVAEVTTT